MKKFTYQITDPQGIHARPAGMLVQEAHKFSSAILIHRADQRADTKRIFAVMSLAVKQGETVSLELSGSDEDAACAAMEAFFKEHL